MKIGKKKDSDSGMTLIEVIVAVSIFAITAAVLLQSFVTSSRINKKSRIYLEATTVAQNIMEEVKSKNLQKFLLPLIILYIEIFLRAKPQCVFLF